MFRKIKKVDYSIVEAEAQKVHEQYKGSEPFTMENLRQLSDREWWYCEVLNESVEKIVTRDGADHNHQGFVLPTSQGKSVGEIAQYYLPAQPGHPDQENECIVRIEDIRKSVRINKKLDLFFLEFRAQEDKLVHIDGLHKAIAWVLEDCEKQPVHAYICMN